MVSSFHQVFQVKEIFRREENVCTSWTCKKRESERIKKSEGKKVCVKRVSFIPNSLPFFYIFHFSLSLFYSWKKMKKHLPFIHSPTYTASEIRYKPVTNANSWPFSSVSLSHLLMFELQQKEYRNFDILIVSSIRYSKSKRGKLRSHFDPPDDVTPNMVNELEEHLQQVSSKSWSSLSRCVTKIHVILMGNEEKTRISLAVWRGRQIKSSLIQHTKKDVKQEGRNVRERSKEVGRSKGDEERIRLWGKGES